MDADTKEKIIAWVKANVSAGSLVSVEIDNRQMLKLKFRGLAAGKGSAEKLFSQATRAWSHMPDDLRKPLEGLGVHLKM